MQDALPRLDDAFDGSKRNGMDRRQLLKMGAWAAPVIVLATAAPAAAASTDPPTTAPYTPPNVVAVTNGDTEMLPRYVSGATSVTGKPWWDNGSYIDFQNPNRLGTNLWIEGIPQASTPRSVSVYFYVPYSTGPLARPKPSQWEWSMTQSNFSSMAAVYEPLNATQGVWRLDFLMPSWGTDSGTQLFVKTA
ncbi:hypothetical protein [Microbacterium telephonicum]|uniref:Uncharacterized protein n=1 Tax=Microbacterium telephonicum TaxID=1714841 RepID=A0A498BZ46_9MICO|nr:hypothetical protein [Microbacterium telephonicum]RLK48007.1 hypothetical protein C7474_2609 [Microbacterium telephonicum]